MIRGQVLHVQGRRLRDRLASARAPYGCDPAPEHPPQRVPAAGRAGDARGRPVDRLGLGAQLPRPRRRPAGSPEWGAMLDAGKDYIQTGLVADPLPGGRRSSPSPWPPAARPLPATTDRRRDVTDEHRPRSRPPPAIRRPEPSAPGREPAGRLRRHAATSPRSSTASPSRVDSGRVPGDRRRVRLGQERHRPHPGRADRRGLARRRRPARARRQLAARPSGPPLARLRGAEIGFVLQDALVSLDPLRRSARRSPSRCGSTAGAEPSARQRVIELLTEVGVPEPEVRARQRPARALRRPPPAGADRLGDRDGPEPAHRRRADHGARRHRPGADPGAAAEDQGARQRR